MTASAHTDELLEEYLRVINNKDCEIHRLITEIERLNLDLKRRDDKYKSRFRQLKLEVDQAHTIATADAKTRVEIDAEVGRLTRENELLMQDVATLRTALQKSEDQLHGIQRASSKASKHETHCRQRLEQEFELIRIELEEKLRSALRRVHELEGGEKEGGRVRQEVVRLQQEITDMHKVHKELKKRNKELISKESHSAEIAQMEIRHRELLVVSEREVHKARDDLREVKLQLTKSEAAQADMKTRYIELEGRHGDLMRQCHELELSVANEKLKRSQALEELRIAHNSDTKSRSEQVERLVSEHSSAAAEVTALRQRIQSQESQAQGLQARHNEEVRQLQQQIQQLRNQLSESNVQLEGSKKIIAQHESHITKVETRTELHQREAKEETLKLRHDIQMADESVAKHVASLAYTEKVLEETRLQVQQLQSELSHERALAHKKENDHRHRVSQMEESVRHKEDEKKSLVEQMESILRDREQQHHAEKALRAKELSRTAGELSAARHDHHDKISACEVRIGQLKAEVEGLKADLATKHDKEQALLNTIRTQDGDILKNQLALSERDACIVALRRNLSTLTTTQATTEDEKHNVVSALEVERTRTASLEQKLTQALQTLAKRDDETQGLATTIKRLEEATHAAEIEQREELDSVKVRVQQLLKDLQASQQQVSISKVELDAEMARHSEELITLRRDVLAPLQTKVETLVSTNQRLTRELREKDEQLSEVNRKASRSSDRSDQLQADLASKDRKLAALAEELSAVKEQLTASRRAQMQLTSDKEEAKKIKFELDLVMRKSANAEEQLHHYVRELNDLRDNEALLQQQLATERTQLATLKERYANLESLKSISDNTVRELQVREREQLEALETMRSSQHMMQMCFDKQQEQFEQGRRLRQDRPRSQATPT